MYVNGTIAGVAIVAGSITANEIAADTITADKIQAGAINTSELAINSVDIFRLIDGAASNTTAASGTSGVGSGGDICPLTLDIQNGRAVVWAIAYAQASPSAVSTLKIDGGVVRTVLSHRDQYLSLRHRTFGRQSYVYAHGQHWQYAGLSYRQQSAEISMLEDGRWVVTATVGPWCGTVMTLPQADAEQAISEQWAVARTEPPFDMAIAPKDYPLFSDVERARGTSGGAGVCPRHKPK